MKRKLCIVSFLCVLSLIWSGLEMAQAETPPLKAGRLTGELLAGLGGQMVGIVAGIGLAALILPDGQIFVVGPIVGGALGSSAGVYWVGTSFSDQVGSYWVAVGCNILFTGAFILCDYAGFFPKYAPVHRTLGYFILPTVASTIGFNLTRRYKSPPASGSQTNPAAPPIYFNLVRVRF